MPAITLRAHGKDYTLNPLGTNALCALQERLGKNFGQIMVELGVLEVRIEHPYPGWLSGLAMMNLSTVRIFLQECIVEKIGDDEMNALIDEIGFDGFSKAIQGLIVPAREIAA